MVSKKMQLHLASNLEQLIDKCNDLKIFHSLKKEPTKLMDSIKKLNDKLQDTLKKPEQDEELIYLLSFRMMTLWQVLEHTDEFKADSKYYKCMIGKEIQKAFKKMEEVNCSLKNRYETEVKKKEEKITLERRRMEVTGADKPINKEPYNYFMTDSSQDAVLSQVEEPVSIQCKEFLKKILENENILIIDTRPEEDFQTSRLKKGKIMNIPSTLIKPGMSAAMLRKKLLSDEDKYKWDHRDEYKQIIMLDWRTEERTLTPGSTLHVLKTIFLKWDPHVTYKEKPLILEGGYERWLDNYPYLTTNANPKRPQVNDGIHFVPLDEIEYPMADLAESIIPLLSKTPLQSVLTTPTTSTVSSHMFTPQEIPVIDRSTKPSDTFKPIASSTKLEGDTKPLNESSLSEKESHNKIEVTPPPAISKPPPEKPSIIKKPDVSTNSLPATVKEQPRPTETTPTKKTTTEEIGDEDSDISLSKLKSSDRNSPGFSSGLKRSRSSPNIAQLNEDITRKSKPQIDRSVKPSPITSYSDSFSPRSHGNVPRGLTGLKNLGNLCYMNSIVQCVSNTEELKKQLISLNTPFKINRNSKTRGQVFDALKQLIFLLHQGAYRWVTCQELKNVVGQFRNTFAGYEQQDSHEFLTELMDWLHEDLNCPSPNFSLEGACEETGERAWGEFKKKNESIVLELFYGQLRSTITCNECFKQSVTFDPFSNLSLPLPMDKDKCKLSDCIRLYLTGETISGWNCPRCKSPRQAMKKFDITRLPPVLVIHLKRFMTEGVGTGWSRKRPNMVDFPLEDLDMRQYAVNSEQRFHTYNLYAVSNHYGTMDSGHYTAYCKNSSYNKWYKFDDQEVGEMSPSEVKTSAAYILFYSTVSRN